MLRNLTSRYVVKTEGLLYNTMTKQTLPEDAGQDELRAGLFLAGQERESLERTLFEPPKESLSLRILPTWECNLRCNHCCVLGLLKAKDDCQIDPTDVVRLCRLHRQKYGTKKLLIKARECLAIIETLMGEFGEDNTSCSLTTNLALPLDETSVRLLSMSIIDVSLDGMEDQHNWQRKSADKSLNPHRRTFCNLARLVKLGMADKINVQAAVQQDVYEEKKYKEYIRSLLKIGIKKILYGTCYPTRQNPEPDQIYLDCLQKPRLLKRPCCDYRFMGLFTINSKNEIVGDYFGLSDAKPLKLSELGKSYDLESLERHYEEKMRGRLNILHDKTCLEQCPVVAYCWGGCQNSEFISKEPSKYCNMAGLKEMVDGLASRDELISTNKESACGGKS